ncbi:GNAT family N-acetyltransferase [Sphingomonas sp. RT2P30]|uniref:GNAT family N-acetyltransferase n=1 Tax=Parasphingomonas halimpatiens TaxID=3096162 RepID=UPI002FC9CB15
MMVELHPMTDRDYAWLLGEAPRGNRLRLCDGGIAPDEVTAMLRGVTAGLAAADDRPLAWLIADGDAVVGMTSFTKRDADGRYEIGYGVAPAHEGRGVMSAAIALLLPMLRGDGHRGLTAATGVDNPGSPRVLEKNGFVPSGTRDDPEDGPLNLWAIDLTTDGRPR